MNNVIEDIIRIFLRIVLLVVICYFCVQSAIRLSHHVSLSHHSAVSACTTPAPAPETWERPTAAAKPPFSDLRRTNANQSGVVYPPVNASVLNNYSFGGYGQ